MSRSQHMASQVRQLYQALFGQPGDIFWQVSPDLKIISISPEIQKLTGYTARQVSRLPLEKLLQADSAYRLRQSTRQLLEDPSPPGTSTQFRPFKLELACKDGGTAWVDIFAVILRDPEGRIAGYEGIARPYSSAALSGPDMLQAEALFKTVMEHLGEGIGVVDAQERFIYSNATADAIFAVLPNSLPGHSLAEFITPEQYAELQKLTLRRFTGVTSAYLLSIRRPDGALRTLSVTATPWLRADGTPAGSLGIFRDITETLQAEEILRQNAAHYRAIVEDQTELILRFLPSGKITFANAAYCRYFGVDQQGVIATNMMAPISIEDRPRLHAQLAALNNACQAVTYEVQVNLPDGSTRWQQRTDRVIFDDTGKVVEYQAVGRDIHERRLAEDQLRSAQAQLAERVQELEARNREINLLTQMSNALMLCSQVGDACDIATEFALRFFPETSGSILVYNLNNGQLEQNNTWGKASTGFTHGTLPEECFAFRHGRVHQSPAADPSDLCSRLTHPGPSSVICLPLFSQGRITGIFHLARATGEPPLTQAQANLAMVVSEQFGLALSNLNLRENLRQQAIRDSLTGLFNRYFMESSLEQEINRAERSGRPVSLVMLDIDHFKAFNDTYTHQAGDILLAELGRLLRSMVRSGDIACRYGGEEFLLILPETSLDIAAERAEQIRQAFERLEITFEDQRLDSPNVSLGVACYPQNGMKVSTLLKSVDIALYRAKEEGRNRVVTA